MSLKLCCFASGSKGNCCYVSDGRTDILIDMGISATRAENCLRVLGVDPNGVRVLVTHSHSDHIGGLKVFCKKHPSVKVICQREVAPAVARGCGIVPYVAGASFKVGTLEVTAVPVSHDVPCFGYIVSDGAKSVAVVTDIGYVSAEQLSALSRCGIVVLESNHDIAMLKANPRYTPVLKQRILSAHGHLSNDDCASACAFLASNGVKSFILAHLSEENNDPEIALKSVRAALGEIGASGVSVVAARQDGMTGLYEVC